VPGRSLAGDRPTPARRRCARVALAVVCAACASIAAPGGAVTSTAGAAQAGGVAGVRAALLPRVPAGVEREAAGSHRAPQASPRRGSRVTCLGIWMRWADGGLLHLAAV